MPRRSQLSATGKVVVDLYGIVDDVERLSDLVEHLANEARRPARHQAVEERSADVESIALSRKARRAPAGRRVPFDDEDVEVPRGEQRPGDETADACAYNNDVVFGCRQHRSPSPRRNPIIPSAEAQERPRGA